MGLTHVSGFVLAVIFALSVIAPAIRKMFLERARMQALTNLGRTRHSRVIPVIQRSEGIASLGIPIRRRVVEDPEKALGAIWVTDPETPIDLVLHTGERTLRAAEQIAEAICRHPAKVTVIVPRCASQGSRTWIARGLVR